MEAFLNKFAIRDRKVHSADVLSEKILSRQWDEQIANFRQMLPLLGGAQILIATSTSFALYESNSLLLIGMWLGLILLSGLTSLWAWYKNKDRKPQIGVPVKYLQRASWSGVYMGLVWGTGVYLFFPEHSLIGQSLLTFVVGGMTAGTMAALWSLPTVGLAFTLFAVAPLMLRLLMFDESIHYVMANMLGIYFISLVLISRCAYARFVEGVAVKSHLSNIVDSVNQLQLGLAIYDSDERLVFVNERRKEMYPETADIEKPGTLVEDVLRARGKTGLNSEAKGREEARLRERIEEFRNPAQPIERKRRDGVYYLIDEKKLSDGGTVSIISDITERKKAEDALRESEARFRDYATAASDWFWMMDEELQYTDVSDDYHRAIGAPLGWMIGKTVEETNRYYPSLEMKELWENSTAARKPFKNLVAYREMPDGQKQWSRIGAVPLIDKSGTFRGYRGVNTDITAEVIAHDEAEASRQLLFNALDQFPEYILLFDSNDHLVFGNAVLRKMHNQYFDSDLHGMTFEDYIRQRVNAGRIPVAEGRIEDYIQERLEQHRRKAGPFRVKLQWEREVWLEVHDYAIPDGGSLIFYIDVTEFVVQEEHLRRSQRMEAVGQLAGGIAHDFNNLLGAMLGNAELVECQVPENQTAMKRIEAIKKVVDRGASLTNRLLAFSRQQTLAPVATNISRLVDGLDDMLRRTLGETIDLRIGHTPDLWLATIDPYQLEHALVNLAINARDAMPQGGTLTIETGNVTLEETYTTLQDELTPGDYAMVAVSDSGTGMPPEVLRKVFEPFFTTKDVGKGTGLGLSMVYGFARQSRGHISIYSEVDKGTTFKLYLPRSHEAVAQDDTAGDRREPERGSERVLVVEDDPNIRVLSASFLRNQGYDVVLAENGEQAIGHLKGRKPFDLLFTDVVLPGGMNGVEIAEEAKQLQPNIKVLYTTGYTKDAVIHNGQLDSGENLVNKPYRRIELLDKVRALLDTVEV